MYDESFVVGNSLGTLFARCVWFAIVVVGWAILVNGREPFVDIALYAVERLFR